ncbi:MAG: tripartite tricarboxylate transporter substrate binding protein [Betaproteobacteria bacterium]|nr:MAG: tripartite tricarboxylate transporter substrate binding protein [Betaproteobacteria bacterium]
MPTTTRRIAGMFLGALIMAGAALSTAAAFPERPIRLIVPFAANGPNDVLARLVGVKLTEAWGQQVVVDNRPGAGTIIGTELLVRAQPDGHTLLMISASTVVNPTLKKKLPYDTRKDLTPVVQLASSPTVLVVHPGVKAGSIPELLALAKASPGALTYASGGTGTTTHLAGELFAITGGIKWTHVPYKGTGPANIDLLGGRVSGMFGTILPVLPHIKSGRMRALGVSSLKRSPALPDVPAVAESLPGFEAVSFFGIAAPAGVPQPVLDKLNREIARIITAPDMSDSLRKQGTDAVGNTQAEFTAFFNREMAKWAKIIKSAGIAPS